MRCSRKAARELPHVVQEGAPLSAAPRGVVPADVAALSVAAALTADGRAFAIAARGRSRARPFIVPQSRHGTARQSGAQHPQERHFVDVGGRKAAAARRKRTSATPMRSSHRG
jgi:hypothetical protein